MYSYIQLKNINNDDDRYLNKLRSVYLKKKKKEWYPLFQKKHHSGVFIYGKNNDGTIITQLLEFGETTCSNYDLQRVTQPLVF